MRGNLTALRNNLEKDKDKVAAVVRQRMQHWLSDPDFNGVRGAAALAKLPEAERGDWQRLWEEVAALHARAQTKLAAALVDADVSAGKKSEAVRCSRRE